MVCREYSGVIVRQMENGIPAHSITQREALRVGMKVATPSLATPSGWMISTVERRSGKLCLKAGPNVGFLTFGADDRKCWVCTEWANLPAIQKLKL